MSLEGQSRGSSSVLNAWACPRPSPSGVQVCPDRAPMQTCSYQAFPLFGSLYMGCGRRGSLAVIGSRVPRAIARAALSVGVASWSEGGLRSTLAVSTGPGRYPQAHGPRLRSKSWKWPAVARGVVMRVAPRSEIWATSTQVFRPRS